MVVPQDGGGSVHGMNRPRGEKTDGPRTGTPESGRSLERRGFPPGGVRLLLNGSDALVGALSEFEVWDLNTGVQKDPIKLPGGCRSLGVWEVLPEDQGIAVGCREGGFLAFDLDGEVIQRFELSPDAQAYLTKESPGLASFGSMGHPDGSWEDRSRRFAAYSTPSSIAIDGRGVSALVAYGQAYALLWDLRSGELLQALGEERPDGVPRRIYEIAITADGTLAATRGNADGIAIWGTRDRGMLGVLPVAGPDVSAEVDRPTDMPAEAAGRGGAGAMAFIPGSAELVAAEGPELLRIEASSGKTLGRWVGHEERHPIMGEYRSMPRIHDLRFSGDGRRALTVGVDSTLRVWDVRSGSQLWAVRPEPCCVDWADLSRDGKRVVWTACPGMAVYQLD